MTEHTEQGLRSHRDGITNKRRALVKAARALFMNGWNRDPGLLNTMGEIQDLITDLKDREIAYRSYSLGYRHDSRIGIDKFMEVTKMTKDKAMEYVKSVPMRIVDILRYYSERGHLPAPVGAPADWRKFVVEANISYFRTVVNPEQKFFKVGQPSIFNSKIAREIGLSGYQLNDLCKVLEVLGGDHNVVVIQKGASMGPTHQGFSISKPHCFQLTNNFLDEMRKLTGFGTNTLFPFMKESGLSESAALDFARSTERLPSREEWPLLLAKMKQAVGRQTNSLFESILLKTGKSANDWIKEGAEIILSANTILEFVLQAKRLPTHKEAQEIRIIGISLVLLKLASPNQ